ncbi:hypothetical protein TRAPUB_6802 [Trametes pubescens]|uniref:Uncharacterized protein n=1 Tax=Trametes pubescens TaxID=154538 RepID=A0A1M2W6Q6_TRAPU|nr:hypothetical protein TRAPUB_6802 [Trametes pubescens]
MSAEEPQPDEQKRVKSRAEIQLECDAMNAGPKVACYVQRSYGQPEPNKNQQQDVEGQNPSEPEVSQVTQPQPRASMEMLEKPSKKSMNSKGRSSSESTAVAVEEEAKSSEKVDEPVVESEQDVSAMSGC